MEGLVRDKKRRGGEPLLFCHFIPRVAHRLPVAVLVFEETLGNLITAETTDVRDVILDRC